MSDGVRYTCPSCGRHVAVCVPMNRPPWCGRCGRDMVTMWDMRQPAVRKPAKTAVTAEARP